MELAALERLKYQCFQEMYYILDVFEVLPKTTELAALQHLKIPSKTYNRGNGV